MLKSRDTLIFPCPQDIIICYAEDQPAYKELSFDTNIRFVKGLDFELTNIQVPKIIIIDDLMTSSSKSKEVQELFTKGVHHSNASVIFLTQNLFNQGKYARDIRLNTHYMVIFRSPTFYSQVGFLGRQIMPQHKNFILEAYKDATVKFYSYLFIILHPKCDDRIRVRAGILPGESEIVYTPK